MGRRKSARKEPRPTQVPRKLTMLKVRKSTRHTLPGPPVPIVPAVAAGRLAGEVRAEIEGLPRADRAGGHLGSGRPLLAHRQTYPRGRASGEAADYGEKIVQALSAQLTAKYGRGYGRRNLFQMIRFAEAFPDPEIVSALSKQLSWSHLVEILPLQDPLKRDFYAELCRVERWSVRTLRRKIGHLLYERTAVSKKPDELIVRDLAELRDEDRMTPDLVFRDPYFLDFLGLTGTYAETDVEQAILRELEAFILELGSDFAFVARQKRILVDNEDWTELPPRELLEKTLHDSIRRARDRLVVAERETARETRPQSSVILV